MTGEEPKHMKTISSVVDYYAGIYYLINNDTNNMLINMEMSAKCGNINAMRMLSAHYENIDKSKMLEYCHSAIHKNDYISMNNLGCYYLRRYLSGTINEPRLAIKYFKMAAKYNYSDALINLGNIYEKDDDHQKAFKYWILGAYFDTHREMYVLDKILADQDVCEDYYESLVTFIREREYLKEQEEINDNNVIRTIARLILRKREIKSNLSV